MFPRGGFAGIAPSGRPVISGGATGLEVLEIALANWPVPEPTKGGTPPDMQPELCKLYGPPPPVDAEYFRERCSSPDWFDSDEDLACYTGYDNRSSFLCSAPGWVDSSWTSRPNTWTSRPSRDEPGTGEPKVADDWVDQSWHSNAPKTQASTRTNQSDSYYHNDDHNDDNEPWPLESDNEEEYPYEPVWSTAPPSYNYVPVPESKWQPYNMPQCTLRERPLSGRLNNCVNFT